MKKLSTLFNKAFLFLASTILFGSVQAAVNDFSLSLRNIQQTAPNVLEFDVYLLDTDASNDFYLSTQQFGIMFNSAIYTGGTISAVRVNTGSGLGLLQRFAANPQISTDDAFPNQSVLKLVGPMAQIDLEMTTLVSKVSPGTFLTRLVLTSTVPFLVNSTPDFAFNSSLVIAPLYATRIIKSDGTEVIELPVTPGVNTQVDGNPVLNAYTGLAQSQIEAVSIYPNPMVDELNIELKGNTELSTYEILNGSGQLVTNGQFVEKTTVATKNFSTGIYVVKIVYGGHTSFQKLIKK